MHGHGHGVEHGDGCGRTSIAETFTTNVGLAGDASSSGRRRALMMKGASALMASTSAASGVETSWNLSSHELVRRALRVLSLESVLS